MVTSVNAFCFSLNVMHYFWLQTLYCVFLSSVSFINNPKKGGNGHNPVSLIIEYFHRGQPNKAQSKNVSLLQFRYANETQSFIWALFTQDYYWQKLKLS